MRYRIEIDVHKPLLTGFFLERIGRPPTWISLKYERLPNICFKCGVFSHDTRSCNINQSTTKTNTEFGSWLRAEDRSEFVPRWPECDAVEPENLNVQVKDSIIERVHPFGNEDNDSDSNKDLTALITEQRSEFQISKINDQETVQTDRRKEVTTGPGPCEIDWGALYYSWQSWTSFF